MVEIKPNNVADSDLQTIVNELSRYGFLNTGHVISFQLQPLQALRKLCPTVNELLITNAITNDSLLQAISIGGPSGIDVNSGLTAQGVIYAHNDGLSVGVWTLNPGSSLKSQENYLESIGVDILTIDS